MRGLSATVLCTLDSSACVSLRPALFLIYLDDTPSVFLLAQNAALILAPFWVCCGFADLVWGAKRAGLNGNLTSVADGVCDPETPLLLLLLWFNLSCRTCTSLIQMQVQRVQALAPSSRTHDVCYTLSLDRLRFLRRACMFVL